MEVVYLGQGRGRAATRPRRRGLAVEAAATAYHLSPVPHQAAPAAVPTRTTSTATSPVQPVPGARARPALSRN